MLRASAPSRYAMDVITTLIGRELRIRYKGSALGLLWAVLSPLGTVAILHFLFSQIVPLHIPHYAAFIYSGLLPWTWFQSAVQTGATTLADNRDLVRKPFFPRAILPAVVTGTNYMLYLLALPILLGLLVIEGLPLSPALAALPVLWLVQALFTLACATLVAALGVLIRDVQHLLGMLMLLWFYLTPIFYDLHRVDPARARWLTLNPMAIIIQAHRDLLLPGAEGPDWAAVGLTALFSLALLGASLKAFHLLEDAFVEEV